MEEVQEMSSKSQRLSHDNEILKDELHKLQDVEVQHFKAVCHSKIV